VEETKWLEGQSPFGSGNKGANKSTSTIYTLLCVLWATLYRHNLCAIKLKACIMSRIKLGKRGLIQGQKHWLSWDNLFHPKHNGELGFWSTRVFNLALLAR